MYTIVKCLPVFLCFILLDLQFAAFGTRQPLSVQSVCAASSLILTASAHFKMVVHR